ncbi:MAG: ABC transporter permease [Dehalococcoidia bacterium]|nr:ABC transporter permease [Dehalococcoidia bacterium]
MRAYVIKRLLLTVPVLLGVTVLTFVIMRVMPGDAAMAIVTGGGQGAGTLADMARVRAELNLDQPLHIQYVEWLWRIVRLDLGHSWHSGRPIVDEIKLRFPVTFELAVLTVLMSILIAIPTGVICALRQDTLVDQLLRIVSVFGLTMPSFWTGTLILFSLVVWFNWFPPMGYTGLFENPLVNLQQVIWPALAVGYFLSAYLARMTRATMLEVLRQDYIRTAWSKGLKERAVVIRHALKNMMLPVVTLAGIQIAVALEGSVVAESIFMLPGMGLALVGAIQQRDYPVIQTFMLVLTLIVMVVNLLVDITYGWLDPRIRFS